LRQLNVAGGMDVRMGVGELLGFIAASIVLLFVVDFDLEGPARRGPQRGLNVVVVLVASCAATAKVAGGIRVRAQMQRQWSGIRAFAAVRPSQRRIRAGLRAAGHGTAATTSP
jgi:hypothetical protein